jgi:aryl-alcohol dehydrogenase-like predicted oxidoreductase
LAAGITDFDTAPWYGSGASEERLGRALRTVDPGQGARIITKAGRLFREADGTPAGAGFDAPDRPSITTRVCSNDFTAAGCRTSLAESLARLGMPRIHTLRIHDPNDNSLNRRGMASFVDEVAIANGPDGMIGEMINLRRQGVVDSIGLGMNCNQEGYMGAPDEVWKSVRSYRRRHRCYRCVCSFCCCCTMYLYERARIFHSPLVTCTYTDLAIDPRGA